MKEPLCASNVPHLDWGLQTCKKQSSYTLKIRALYHIVCILFFNTNKNLTVMNATEEEGLFPQDCNH